jgi:hypothetical protein
MSSNTITIKAELADKDRKLLADVLAAITGATGKLAPAASGKKKEPEAEAGEDGGDGDGDGGEFDGGDGDGEGDGGEFDGGDGDGGDGEKAPERADVHKAMKEYSVAAGSAAEAIKLMAKHGGTEKLSLLKPEKFAAVIAAMNSATAKAKKKK